MDSIVRATMDGTVTCQCKFILYEIWMRLSIKTHKCGIGFQKRTKWLVDPIK